MTDKIDFGTSGYILGILSIILAVVSPLAGLVTGIVGLVMSRKEKTELSKRGKKLNIVGIVLSTIFLAVSLAFFWIAFKQGLSSIGNLPIA